MEIRVPRLSLLVLIGASGCGKSTSAARLFRSTEIVSSDHCRALVSDDEDNQIATRDAFDVLHLIVAKRLARGRLTVVDATNVQRSARRPLLEAAERHYVPAVAVVFDLPEEVCVARAGGRPGRDIGPDVVRARRAAPSLPRRARGGGLRPHVRGPHPGADGRGRGRTRALSHRPPVGPRPLRHRRRRPRLR